MEGQSTTSLRNIIKSELSRDDIQLKIRDALHSVDHKENIGNHGSKHGHTKVMEELNSQGIVDSIMSNIMASNPIYNKSSSHTVHTTTVSSSARHQSPHRHHSPQHHHPVAMDTTDFADGVFLQIELVRGRAFIEHLLESSGDISEDESMRPGHSRGRHRHTSSTNMLSFCLAFRQQRFQSRLVPCTSEPDINEVFSFRLTSNTADQVSLSSLLATKDPVHLVIVKHDTATGESRLLSSLHVEWRVLLCAPNGRSSINLELKGVGPEAKMSTGVLEVNLELSPQPNDVVDEDVVSSQLGLERGRQAEKERVFLVYAKSWWKDYCQIRDEHVNRSVKIFAQDENEENRFVCSYVHPLRAGRLLEMPRQCARFVSSIPFERSAGLGTGPKEQWATGHAFLSRNRGDVEDHAVLLCSLLLGFGLDAYVAVGTRERTNQQEVWVITLQGTSGDEAIFWDPVKGKRYLHKALRPERFPEELPGPAPTHPYRTLGCLFNHRAFYANNHPVDAVETAVFNLQDESRWKGMSQDAVGAVVDSVVIPSLCPPSKDPIALSNDLEHQLRSLVMDLRRDFHQPGSTGGGSLTTQWDSGLSYLLTQALAAYEMEQMTGGVAGNDEFQAAVRRHVQDGHTFKAYPLQVLHTNPRRALQSALKSQTCQQILLCRGDQVKLALRVRVYCYAEQATVAWIMFACTYRSVP